MKQASLLSLTLLLLQGDDALAHTPFRHTGATSGSSTIFGAGSRVGGTSSSSQLLLDRLLSGGGQADDSASSLARGGSTRTASFAADDEDEHSATTTTTDQRTHPEPSFEATAKADASRRVHEIEGYLHLDESGNNNNNKNSTMKVRVTEMEGVVSLEDVQELASQNNTMDTSSPREPTKKKLQLPFRKKKDDSHKRHKQIAKSLKNRNSVNIRRKVMHAAFGLTFALLNNIIPRHRFVPGMAILSTATLIMELLRYRKGFGWMNEALHFVLGSSLRKHEMDGKFTGSFYFFTGVTLTAYLYPGTAASLGIAQLALADPSASYFGRQTRHVYWSRIENGLGGFGRNKGWLGFLGGALFCFPFNYHVLSRAVSKSGLPVQVMGAKAVIGVSLLLGLAGALADLAVPTPALVLPKKILGVKVPPFHVDDNMVVPIFSAYACTKVFEYYGWPLDLALTKWMVL